MKPFLHSHDSSGLYSQVLDRHCTPVAPNTSSTPPNLKSVNQYASIPHGKSQTMRRLHSTGNIPTDRDIPSPSPLAREKEMFTYTHLEPDREVSLQDLVTKHYKMLPLRVRVCKTNIQDAAASRNTFAAGGLYNLHFTQHKKLAAFTVSAAESFTLPIDSKVKCALVYNPEGNASKAITGYTFRDVADLIKARPMPMVVCATQLGASRKVESAFMPGEILALKHVQDNQDRVCLGAYSFKTESIKVLEEGCNGYFTTQPSDIQLPLQSVVKEISPKLPCEVQLFGVEGEPGVPAGVGSLLLSLQVVESVLLIATRPQAPDEVLEVPVVSKTEVKFVEVGGKDLLEMKSETGRLQSKYGQTKRTTCRSVSASSIGSTASSASYPSQSSEISSPSGSRNYLYDLPYNESHDDAHAQSTAGRLPAGYVHRGSLPVNEDGSSGKLKRNLKLDPLLPPSPSLTSKACT